VEIGFPAFFQGCQTQKVPPVASFTDGIFKGCEPLILTCKYELFFYLLAGYFTLHAVIQLGVITENLLITVIG